MRLTESMYWIGGGRVGISHEGDCNMYLLRGPDGFVMVDTGGGVEPEWIEKQLRWDGVNPTDIRVLLITHPHVDHAAGTMYWKKRCGAEVLAPELAADYMRRGGDYSPETKPGLSVIPACQVDRTVEDGQEFSAAGLRLTAFHTPGHCESSMAYVTELDGRRVLVAGDCFYFGGKVTVFWMHDADREVFRKTLLRLQHIPFDAFLPGHNFPVLTDGRKHLDLAIEEIDRQLSETVR